MSPLSGPQLGPTCWPEPVPYATSWERSRMLVEAWLILKVEPQVMWSYPSAERGYGSHQLARAPTNQEVRLHEILRQVQPRQATATGLGWASWRHVSEWPVSCPD